MRRPRRLGDDARHFRVFDRSLTATPRFIGKSVQPRRGKAAGPHRDPLGCRVQPFGNGFDTKTVEPEQDDAGALTIPHTDRCRSRPASQFRHNARLRLQLLDRSRHLPNVPAIDPPANIRRYLRDSTLAIPGLRSEAFLSPWNTR